MVGWQSSCEGSHTWWLGTYTIHSTIHCHLQSAWPSPSSCAGSLPQRFHTALVLDPYGQTKRQPEQQSHHPGKGANVHCDCDTHYLGRQGPLPLTSCGWVVHFNILHFLTPCILHRLKHCRTYPMHCRVYLGVPMNKAKHHYTMEDNELSDYKSCSLTAHLKCKMRWPLHYNVSHFFCLGPKWAESTEGDKRTSVNVRHSLHNWYNVCSVPWALWMALPIWSIWPYHCLFDVQTFIVQVGRDKQRRNWCSITILNTTDHLYWTNNKLNMYVRRYVCTITNPQVNN